LTGARCADLVAANLQENEMSAAKIMLVMLAMMLLVGPVAALKLGGLGSVGSSSSSFELGSPGSSMYCDGNKYYNMHYDGYRIVMDPLITQNISMPQSTSIYTTPYYVPDYYTLYHYDRAGVRWPGVNPNPLSFGSYPKMPVLNPKSTPTFASYALWSTQYGI
jgi:hypothetical protein